MCPRTEFASVVAELCDTKKNSARSRDGARRLALRDEGFTLMREGSAAPSALSHS